MKHFMEETSPEEHIKQMEAAGLLDPKCAFCQECFYPLLRNGRKLFDIFAPRHKASGRCQSGKGNHCTCDTCF